MERRQEVEGDVDASAQVEPVTARLARLRGQLAGVGPALAATQSRLAALEGRLAAAGAEAREDEARVERLQAELRDRDALLRFVDGKLAGLANSPDRA